MESKTIQNNESLKTAIHIRYAEAASSCCSLSCGGAFEYADIQKDEFFLDLGSGRGTDVMKASRKAGPEGFAYGVDFTEEMLNTAETNRRKLRLENVKFINAEIDSIPLKDAEIDVIISNCTINHAKNKTTVYKEIFRLLKPG
ncbi:MAG: methyltransferase domain-containing protein, partial [Spirochaetia bacterium]|nr:methyltransferase domain-containing protein [Spirochaetia bacterium]